MSGDPRLAGILEDAEAFARSQLILEPHAYVLFTAQVQASLALAAFERFPIGNFWSPAPGCGKTVGLETVLRLAGKKRAHLISNISEPALFRLAGKRNRILLADEADAMLGKGERSEQLRGLFNSVHTAEGSVWRTDLAAGIDGLREWPVYASLWIAGIGDLPPTLIDRSIRYTMRRATGEEMKALTPLRAREVEPAVGPIRDALSTWAAENLETLAAARPAMPEGLTPRQADCSEPLLAVADLAGGRWPDEVRDAISTTFLGADAAPPRTYGITLLEGLAQVFADAGEETDFLTTADLLKALVKLDSGPFASKYRGDFDRSSDLNGAAQRLAYHLSGFQIRPRPRKIDGSVLRGYYREEILEQAARYVPGCEVAAVAGSGRDTSLEPIQGDLLAERSTLPPQVATLATPATEPATWEEPPGGFRPIAQVGLPREEAS